MGAVTVGVGAQRRAGQPVHAVVAIRGAVLRARADQPAGVARRRRAAAGGGAGRAGPDEPREVVRAEDLGVGPLRQDGHQLDDVRERVIGRRDVVERARRAAAGGVVVAGAGHPPQRVIVGAVVAAAAAEGPQRRAGQPPHRP